MKKLFTLLCLVIACGLIHAQNLIDKHYQHFVDLEESTVIHVSALTFQYASNFVPQNEQEAKEFKEFLQSINSFDLVKISDLAEASNEYRNGLNLLGNNFDELLNVKDKESRFSLYIDEEDGVVYELVGLGVDDKDFVVFSLTGEMRLEQIGDIIGKIQSEKMNPLKPLSDSGVADMRVYPNPVNTQNSFSVDIPEGMMGGKITMIDANGNQVRKQQALSEVAQIETNALTPGYYFVSIEKDGIIMKKKILIVR